MNLINKFKARKKMNLFLCIFLSVLIIMFYFFFRPGGLLASTEFGHLVSLIINLNSIEIEAIDLEKSKVQVYWDTYKNKSVLLINKGEIINNVKSCYGGNLFTIVYDGVKIAEKMQMKFNNWHYHKYIFNLYRINDQIKVEFKIIGTDNHIGY